MHRASRTDELLPQRYQPAAPLSPATTASEGQQGFPARTVSCHCQCFLSQRHPPALATAVMQPQLKLLICNKYCFRRRKYEEAI